MVQPKKQKILRNKSDTEEYDPDEEDQEQEEKKTKKSSSVPVKFTQAQLLAKALQQEAQNKKELEEMLEKQREEAIKRKQSFIKKKKINSGDFIKFKSVQVVAKTKKSSSRRKKDDSSGLQGSFEKVIRVRGVKKGLTFHT